MCGDAARELDARRHFAVEIERRIPAFDLLLAFLRRFEIPQLDEARRGVRQRLMLRHAGLVGGDAGIDLARLEHTVDRAEHVGAGTERVVETQVAPAELRPVELALEQMPHLVERLRRGALEREDRLLLVADGEDRALDVFARAAGHELAADRLDDLPLLRTRVLRLVDQHVIDAEVELVQHPGGGGAREQVQRLVDQVLVVEQAAPVLFAAVAIDHFGGDGDERARALARGNRALATEQAADAVLLGLEPREPIRMVLRDRLGDEVLARREVGAGAEHLQVLIDPIAPGLGARGVQGGDVLLVADRSGLQHLDQQRPFLHRDERGGEEIVLDALRGVLRVHAERERQFAHGPVEAAGTLEPGRERVARADGVADHVLEGLVGGDDDRLRQRVAERGFRVSRCLEQDLERELVEQFLGRRLVEHGEARGDVGLERELVQQPRAEGVDGLHLEPARRLQRRSEQPPRPGAFARAGLAASGQSDAFVERGIVQHRPVGERTEDAVRHVGGGGLGEGDAEDLGRIAAAQKQVDHALRQHVRLAGAGIGRNESRIVGVGGVDLHAAHIIGDGAGGGHVWGSCPGRGAACNAATQTRDPGVCMQAGPRVSSAARRRAALRPGHEAVQSGAVIAPPRRRRQATIP